MNDRDRRHASESVEFTDPAAAAAEIERLYRRSAEALRRSFAVAASGDASAAATVAGANYPYVGIEVGPADVALDARLAYGALFDPGVYGTTVTRPDIFGDYYRDQIALLIERHRRPVTVGLSDRPIPLPFVIEESTADLSEAELRAIQTQFALPDLRVIDDAIANGTYRAEPGGTKPLSLFPAERVDYSLQRLHHYTGTQPEHFQRFILFTNYQRYVDAFRAYARAQIADGDEYVAFIEPGDAVTANPRFGRSRPPGEAPAHLPQMPAYHLVREDRRGITLIDIGVGPSNAKTMTDHLAVLRPHCWIMLGHCAGLRRTHYLGDYVLAHAYLRDDHVLDRDLPHWVPVPPIAEIQVALQEAVARVTGLTGHALKSRMRTGTVATTDDRNWELKFEELFVRLNQARAIAVDMESATVAANGFRFRVPYGTLLCVSDKPVHGQIKLRGMANTLYRSRIAQHLQVGVEAIRLLREAGVEQIHSRKLRSFDEPAFR